MMRAESFNYRQNTWESSIVRSEAFSRSHQLPSEVAGIEVFVKA